MAQNDADSDATAYEKLASLNEGDTFTASRLPGEWVVEDVNEDAYDGTNVTAYQKGREHFALLFEGDRAAQSVTPTELVEGDAEEMGIYDLPADTPLYVESRAVEDDEDEDEDEDDEQATLDDLSEGDEITVEYDTTHGNEDEFDARVQSLSESSFTDQVNGAVVYDPDEDRRYRLVGTREVTVKSLKSGSPRTVGYSGTVLVDQEDEEDEEDDEQEATTGDLSDYSPYRRSFHAEGWRDPDDRIDAASDATLSDAVALEQKARAVGVEVEENYLAYVADEESEFPAGKEHSANAQMRFVRGADPVDEFRETDGHHGVDNYDPENSLDARRLAFIRGCMIAGVAPFTDPRNVPDSVSKVHVEDIPAVDDSDDDPDADAAQGDEGDDARADGGRDEATDADVQEAVEEFESREVATDGGQELGDYHAVALNGTEVRAAGVRYEDKHKRKWTREEATATDSLRVTLVGIVEDDRDLLDDALNESLNAVEFDPATGGGFSEEDLIVHKRHSDDSRVQLVETEREEVEDVDEEETVEVRGSELPKPLAEFYNDSAAGLIAIDPDSPDGIVTYESCGRVGGRPALEIPHSDPHLVDESDLPGGSPPPTTFPKLVRKYGLAFEVISGYTYVYAPEEDREIRTDGGRRSDPEANAGTGVGSSAPPVYLGDDGDDEEDEETDEREENSVSCPECGEQGFDGQGIVHVEGTRMFLRKCWNCGTRFAVEDDAPLIPDGGQEITPVVAKFVLPDGHSYGRTVPGGVWHIFDSDERRSLCGTYNDEGIIRGENRGVYRGSLPEGVCPSCVENAPYLELVREAEE